MQLGCVCVATMSTTTWTGLWTADGLQHDVDTPPWPVCGVQVQTPPASVTLIADELAAVQGIYQDCCAPGSSTEARIAGGGTGEARWGQGHVWVVGGAGRGGGGGGEGVMGAGWAVSSRILCSDRFAQAAMVHTSSGRSRLSQQGS
jgi:hypothetical protein